MSETTVTFKFIMAVGALDGKLMGIMELYKQKVIDDKRFIELVQEAYEKYQGEKE